MRIAISGTACQGKSTLVKDFLNQWPSYKTPKKTYRDIIEENKLDNLIYSMWACEKSDNNIDEKFVESCIPLVRESLRDLDIIFFVPITKVAPVEVVEDETRDTEQHIIEEIDYIFKAVHRDHEHNPKTNLFVADDKPPIIEVFGNRRERVEIIKLYIDAEGDAMTPGNLIDEDTLESIEALDDIWKDVDPEENSFIKKEIEKQRKARLNT